MIFYLAIRKDLTILIPVMVVHVEPDICWGFEPCESEKLSINVRASGVAGASVPRPQAGRGLLGVKLLLIEISHSFRRRIIGGKVRSKPWMITITNSSAVSLRADGTFSKVYCFSRRLHTGYSALLEAAVAKRRPLLIGLRYG